MEAYTDFASLYDSFMEETPYDEWCDYIVSVLEKEDIKDGIVAELGAGTGEMTRRLAKHGYDMIGIDNSDSMLNVAKSKEDDAHDILYLCQDMREFELYGTVRAIVSVCDSINYILEEEELKEVFRLVNNYLDPKGILIFDFNTKYKYECVIGDATIAENRENESFIWENFYDPEDDINEYDITFFVREGELFRRFTETHLQRGYTVETMKACVEASGLIFVDAIDAETHGRVTPESERVYIIARENGK